MRPLHNQEGKPMCAGAKMVWYVSYDKLKWDSDEPFMNKQSFDEDAQKASAWAKDMQEKGYRTMVWWTLAKNQK